MVENHPFEELIVNDWRIFSTESNTNPQTGFYLYEKLIDTKWLSEPKLDLKSANPNRQCCELFMFSEGSLPFSESLFLPFVFLVLVSGPTDPSTAD